MTEECYRVQHNISKNHGQPQQMSPLALQELPHTPQKQTSHGNDRYIGVPRTRDVDPPPIRRKRMHSQEGDEPHAEGHHKQQEERLPLPKRQRSGPGLP